MWTVKRPDFDTGKTFDDCTKLIRSPDLKARMAGIRQDILKRSADYDMWAETSEMHLIPRHQVGLGKVAGEDLIKNYTQRMARKGIPTRAIYDALKIQPRNNRCPLCNYGSVETLDHVLPKQIYPGFSVKPTNLVGTCDRCNRLKREAAPTGPGDGFLHPYFDCVNHIVWLLAEVIPWTPPAATFHVGNLMVIDANLVARIQTQFDHLNLARLYSDAAADEIVDIECALQDIFQAGGAGAVAMHLARQCRSLRQANLNSWRAALYDALANSSWYCGGGFCIGQGQGQGSQSIQHSSCP